MYKNDATLTLQLLQIYETGSATLKSGSMSPSFWHYYGIMVMKH